MFPAIFRRLFANEGKGPKLRTDIIPDTLPGKADEATRADTADKWTTARNIALSGAVTGSASVDGSKAVTITTTLANSGVTAGSYGLSANVTPAPGDSFNVPLVQVNAKGVITSAKTCTVKLPNYYGTCATAAGTAAKTVTISGFKLVKGVPVRVRFSNANTAANATLNVNSTGAKAIRYKNVAMPANLIEDEGTYEFVYDGTYWQLVNGGASLATIDPWDIFPMYVPINVFGVKFGGSDGRRAIMPGESTARENWVICDGGSDGKGGTVPDIRGRFIMGASDEYKAGSTGGSVTHSHTISGTVGNTTLTVDQLATHYHYIHYELAGMGMPDGQAGECILGAGTDRTANYVENTGSSQSHTHDFTGSTAQGSTLPMYYTLSYIMRCA